MKSFLRKKSSKILPLCYYDDPILYKKSCDIDEITLEIREFAELMINTMKANDGIGLAAPQVGETLNLVALDIPENDDRNGDRPSSPGELFLLPHMPLVVVNPKLSMLSEQTSNYCEGCLSIPEIFFLVF